MTSTDEIGQVSAAFNSVHRTAIEVATEQAALRQVDRRHVPQPGPAQPEPDRPPAGTDGRPGTRGDRPRHLENLFRLDHLATRMRRNSEDLIVLSGEAPPRRWSQPMPLDEVVRAAVAEVEDYNRVELLPIDDIGLAGQAISDVVHLLAELIENATSFSPPGTKVQIAGQSISSGYVLEIEDRGLGMTDDELVEANERLANPPIVDFALSRMLGLYVVARLAQRYNIKVQLRHSWYGGVTALVLLPLGLTVQAPVPESLEAAQNGGHRPQLAPPARPNLDGAPVQVAPPVAAPPSPLKTPGTVNPAATPRSSKQPAPTGSRTKTFTETICRSGATGPSSQTRCRRRHIGPSVPDPSRCPPARPISHSNRRPPRRPQLRRQGPGICLRNSLPRWRAVHRRRRRRR